MSRPLQQFPLTRLRRSRSSQWARDLVQENQLTVRDLIYPMFVHEKSESEQAISSMPGISRYNLKTLVERAIEAKQLGIPAVAIFPVVDSARKDARGSYALNADNIVCQAIKAVKDACPDLGIICDVALDPFTDHGHDGVLHSSGNGVANDETVELLCEMAVVQARAGCDVLAPSDMMDGRIGEIRLALEQEGFSEKLILSYAAKYASAFYGPFRDAIGSSALSGSDRALGYRDKRGYQMDPANSNEAIREVAMDISEGADWVMVKPGMPYLDVLYRVKKELGVPTFVYQVSGEYAALKFASQNGALDETRCVLESLLAFKRAGADGILTYFAPQVARWLNQ